MQKAHSLLLAGLATVFFSACTCPDCGGSGTDRVAFMRGMVARTVRANGKVMFGMPESQPCPRCGGRGSFALVEQCTPSFGRRGSHEQHACPDCKRGGWFVYEGGREISVVDSALIDMGIYSSDASHFRRCATCGGKGSIRKASVE